jgi:hypothetical protein
MKNRMLKRRGYKNLPLTVSAIAADRGDLNMLKWMTEQGLTISWDAQTYAARQGHLDVLQFLHDNSNMDSVAYEGAASGGNIVIMEWLHANNIRPRSSAISSGLLYGQLAAVEYLRSIGTKWHRTNCIYAALHSAETLEWALDQGAPWNENACVDAAMSGNVGVIELALKRSLPFNRERCNVILDLKRKEQESRDATPEQN